MLWIRPTPHDVALSKVVQNLPHRMFLRNCKKTFEPASAHRLFAQQSAPCTGTVSITSCPALLLTPSCNKLFSIVIRTISGASRELRHWHVFAFAHRVCLRMLRIRPTPHDLALSKVVQHFPHRTFLRNCKKTFEPASAHRLFAQQSAPCTGTVSITSCPALLLTPSCNKLFSIVIRTISGASRELRHWCRSGMAPQYATLCSLRGALLDRHGLARGPLPGGYVPGERGEEEHSFEAALHCVDLRLLQQLHGVHHEGCRLSSAARLEHRRYQH